jgi:hypothetical protein
MPSFAPRSEPIKKKDQLSQKEIELKHAIRNNFSFEKLNKAAEKYRLAKLSMFKARLHEIHEKEFQNKKHTLKIEKIESEILDWNNKLTEEIINIIKAK